MAQAKKPVVKKVAVRKKTVAPRPARATKQPAPISDKASIQILTTLFTLLCIVFVIVAAWRY